ncbi:hypothetical protein K431DRAFT_325549 [Polychaeton citri CBS 116435]|uniref:Uncharacterized protein n=1 Tax=Polychaeton citri CBS 116435 TaxID=1314669 RepID=A0A9P4QC63_9PEZI|nr:hypothetical protein K431DRAFT_325549 [Polychaeton citri CBS 116435]
MLFTITITAAAVLLRPALADWKVNFYADGASCSGEPTTFLEGYEGGDVFCESAISVHDISAEGIEAAGKHVLMYGDEGCLNGVIGVLDTDTCAITPENAPIAAITVENK